VVRGFVCSLTGKFKNETTFQNEGVLPVALMMDGF
jgi:hypothetical protein